MALSAHKGFRWLCLRIAEPAFARRDANMTALDDDNSEVVRALLPIERDAWLEMLLSQTGIQLWSVDVNERTLRVFSAGERTNRQEVYRNFPDSYLESGHVHPNSRDAFRRFAQDLLSGKESDSENFTLQYRETSCYGWAQLKYRMLFDESNHPQRAVGMRTNLSYRSSGEAGFLQRRPAPETLYPHLFANVQADLTQNFVERLEIEGAEESTLSRNGTYSEVVDLFSSRLFAKNEEKPLRSKLGREELLRAFEEGHRWEAARFRMVDSTGSIRRLFVGANMVRNSENGDVLLFAYVSDEDRRCLWERLLDEPASFDPVTGVYDAATFETLARMQASRGFGDACALALVWIEGAREANLAEPSVASSRRRDVATAFAVALDTDCIIGQLRDDALVAFFPDAGVQQDIKRRIEHAMSFVRLSLDDDRAASSLRFVVGAVCSKRAQADYDAMLNRAEALCELYGGDSADIVAFPDEREERQRGSAGLGEEDGKVVPVPLQKGRALTLLEKDVALECLSGMLMSESLDDSMGVFLRCVGSHYEADRAYLLTISRKDRTIVVPYEWFSEGKYGISQVISGKSIDRYPLLARSMDASQPELLARVQSMDAAAPPSWRFAVYPLHEEDGVLWTLNIENPHSIPMDTALLDALVPLCESERARFERAGTSPAQDAAMRRLMGLKNLDSYTDVVYSLSSDVYSSMGALAVDIPELSSISAGEGFERSMGLLMRISEVLNDLFGSGMLFHTRDSEFIVLSPDTIYEVFLDRCARARLILQTSYPDRFRMGYTWADGVFTARSLVNEARSIMRCDDIAARKDAEDLGESSPGVFASAAARLAEDERFAVYLQPKVDLRTGEVTGAEALTRVVGKDGRAYSPSGIVEAMEQEGTIRDLDYLVFDATLALLEDWASRRLRLIPVSVNFSRSTLLTPSCFASVMAIMTRYPDVPSSLVEIEVTESAFNLERETFKGIIDRYHELGIRMSLDDFGSEYSNLSVFANIPFDAVKIDRSLVANVETNDVARSLVRNVAQVCNDRHVACIAEGVETEEQARTLIQEGCNYAQGYYYGKPISAQEFEQKYLRGGDTA